MTLLAKASIPLLDWAEDDGGASVRIARHGDGSFSISATAEVYFDGGGGVFAHSDAWAQEASSLRGAIIRAVARLSAKAGELLRFPGGRLAKAALAAAEAAL